MSLSVRIALITALIFSVAYGAIYYYAESFLLDNYQDVERREAQNVDRQMRQALRGAMELVGRAVDNYLETLDTQALLDGQVSSEAVIGALHERITSMMGNQSANSLLVVTGPDDNLVNLAWFDHEQLQANAVPATVRQRVAAGDIPPPLRRFDETQGGFMLVGNELFVYHTQPLVVTRGSVQVAGLFFYAQSFDQLGRLEELLGGKVRWHRETLLADTDQEILFEPQQTRVRQYHVTLSRQPIAVEVLLPRRLQQAQQAVSLFLSGMGALMLVLAGATYWVVQKVYVQRLQVLTRSLRMLDTQSLRPQRIPVDGQDEIAELAQTSNHLLEALYGAKSTTLSTLRAINDAVFSVDRGGRLQLVNAAAEQLSGRRAPELLGVHYRELLPTGNSRLQGVLDYLIEKTLNSGKTYRDDSSYHFQRGEQQPHYLDIVVTPLADGHQRTQGAVVVLRDVTRFHLLQEQLYHRATHDSLTGLLNRAAFKELLGQTLAGVKLGEGQAWLAVIELDGLQLVNFTHGYGAGDELIKRVSLRLTEALGQGHVLARLGSKKFGLLQPSYCPEAINDVVERMITAVRDWEFRWQGQRIDTAIGVGVTGLSPLVEDVDAALTEAESACYQARREGRNQMRRYHPEDEAVNRHRAETALIAEIKDALAHNRFCLYQQPITRTDGHPGPRYSEVLLRMVDSRNELRLPGYFLPVAERIGLIKELDRWVIAEAFEWLASQRVGAERLRLAINLSGKSLSDSNTFDYIHQQLRQHRIDPAQVSFEVTETEAVSNIHHTSQLLERLRQLGFKLALDDFGTGVSSFAYLQQLPVDTLKIDGRFITEMHKNPTDLAMVRSINELGQVLGMATVAEWVASEESWRAVCELGITYAQGFHIGSPAPLVMLEEDLLDEGPEALGREGAS